MTSRTMVPLLMHVRRSAILGRGERENAFAGFLPCETQLVQFLEIQSELRAGAEEMRDVQGHVVGDGPTSVENCSNAVGVHADLSGQHGSVHTEFVEFFREMFAWMNSTHGQDPS